MPIFQRRSLNERMDSRWFRQPIRAIDASDGEVGFLIGTHWQRFRWTDIRNAKVRAMEALWVASPFRQFMPRPLPRTPTPEEAIALMERRRAESGNKRSTFLRKSGIPTIELLSFQAGDRFFRINMSSVGSHFENTEELRSILLEKLHPLTVHQKIAHRMRTWVAIVAILLMGLLFVATAIAI